MNVLREEDAWISSIADDYLKDVSTENGETVFGEKLAEFPAAARRRIIMNWLPVVFRRRTSTSALTKSTKLRRAKTVPIYSNC